MDPIKPVYFVLSNLSPGDVQTAFSVVVLTWALLAIIVALAAHRRGQNGLAWFVLSLFVPPVATALMLVLLTPTRQRR